MALSAPGRAQAGSIPEAPGYQRLVRAVLAIGIVGGPLAFFIGGLLAPALHDTGRSSIAANAAANPITNGVHLAAFVAASYLLPIGAVGLAWLAHRRSPWLATIAGLLAVTGWLPFSALTALDDLTSLMASLPASGSYAHLLDRFSTDTVMGGYLLVYVIFHLVAYVLLGVALDRGRVIPRWAAWSIVASSPLTIVAFAGPWSPRGIGTVAITLLVLGSLPAARAALRGREATAG